MRLASGSRPRWKQSSAATCRSSVSRSSSTVHASAGLYRGYPWRPEALEAVGRSPFRRLLNASPAALRRRAARRARRASWASSPRSQDRRPWRTRRRWCAASRCAARSSRSPLDTIVVPLRWEGPHLPARAPQPDLGGGARARARAPALARPAAARRGRHRRPAPPVLPRDGPRPAGAVPRALRRAPGRCRDAGGSAARRRRLARPACHRRLPLGAAPHPRLPFADWETCDAMLERAGPRHRRRLPGRGRRASPRPRPVAQRRHRARDGRRPRRPRRADRRPARASVPGARRRGRALGPTVAGLAVSRARGRPSAPQRSS